MAYDILMACTDRRIFTTLVKWLPIRDGFLSQLRARRSSAYAVPVQEV